MNTKKLLLLAPFALASLVVNAQSTDPAAKPKSKEQVSHDKAQEESTRQSETAKPVEEKKQVSPAAGKSDGPAPQSEMKKDQAAPQATEKSNNASPTGQEHSAKPAPAPQPEKKEKKKAADDTPGVETPK